MTRMRFIRDDPSAMPVWSRSVSGVTEGAKVLGVTRTTLSNLINGRAGISPQMAIRLARAEHTLRRWTARARGRRATCRGRRGGDGFGERGIDGGGLFEAGRWLG